MPTTDNPTPRAMSAMEERRPLPDPTTLTTAQLLREIAWLREIVDKEFASVHSRFEENDKAVKLLQEFANRQPTIAEVGGQIKALQDLHQEKFESIQTQFKERDTRLDQSSKDNKVAIDAALSAAKESVEKQNTSNTLAINKSEAAFTKQFDQTNLQINTIVKAVDDKIGDIKERITVIEAKTAGMSQQKSEQRDDTKANWGYIVAIIGLAIPLIALAVQAFK